ncbi:hypothetical protein GQ44DRAFT_732564 [Phaeosphaeriaceae sp. PMI808]|nr:hypothetical protein GQ44DRAFT_732564 [Phaeosphaeriaceae sp. PMI808]
MNIEANCVTAPDSFEKYGLEERRRVSKDRVQDFLSRGLMSQNSVWQRYTVELSEKLSSTRRLDQPTVITDIKQSFQRLSDSKTGCKSTLPLIVVLTIKLTGNTGLSEELFKQSVEEKLLGLGINDVSNVTALLFEIFSLHAFYPFPRLYDSVGHLLIDEDSFVRAVCLVTLSPGLAAPMHRFYSGNWGPHEGWYVALRGKDASDFRRRVFRSLAAPSGDGISLSTTISTPRFMWYEPKEEGIENDNEFGQQFVVAEDESELSIDIVDVLSECPPEADRRTANPFRESYRIALPSLPKHSDDLSVLYIPTKKLVVLLKLIQGVQRESAADLAATIEELSSDGKIGWESFDSKMSEHSECIANGLSRIFDTFK